MPSTSKLTPPVQGSQHAAVTHTYGKLPAKDIDRARAFYTSALGLTPFAERNSHLYYEAGGAYFIIYPSTGEPSGSHDQLGLVVDDLETVLAAMKSMGVKFEDYQPAGATVTDGIADFGHIRAAWFKDTEGNLISLAHFPGGSPFQRDKKENPNDGSS